MVDFFFKFCQEIFQVAVALCLCFFNRCDQICHQQFVVRGQFIQVKVFFFGPWIINQLDHIIDDALKSPFCTIFRGINFGNTVVFKLFNFLWNNHSTTTTEHLDVGSVFFFKKIYEIFEKFHVAALVTGYG